MISVKQEKRVIGGRQTTCTQFGAMRATGLAVRLMKIVGPSVAHLLSADVQSVEDLLKKQVDVGLVVAQLFHSLDEDTTLQLIRDLLSGVVVVHNGAIVELSSDDAINMVFTGKLKLMLESVKFAIQVNYGDFFGDASAQGGSQSASQDQTTSSSNLTTT